MTETVVITLITVAGTIIGGLLAGYFSVVKLRNKNKVDSDKEAENFRLKVQEIANEMMESMRVEIARLRAEVDAERNARKTSEERAEAAEKRAEEAEQRAITAEKRAVEAFSKAEEMTVERQKRVARVAELEVEVQRIPGLVATIEQLTARLILVEKKTGPLNSGAVGL